MRDETSHVSPAELLHLLWIAAHIPGAGRALAHLLGRCDGCETPGTIWEEVVGDLTDSHFDDESLGGVAWAILFYGHPDLSRVLEHLLAQCPDCSRLGRGLFRRRQTKMNPSDYEDLGRRILRYVDDRAHGIERAQRDAPQLLQRLLDQPPERRLLLLRNSARYHHPPLVEALCEASSKQAAASASEALEIATLALEAASRVDPLVYGERIPQDLVALGHAYIGNAWRVANRFCEAEQEFKLAEAALDRGSGLSVVNAEIGTLKASWTMVKGDVGSARRLLSRAAAVFAEVGDDLRLARVLVKHAFICREGGEPEEACLLLSQADPLLDPVRDPRLTLCARHNHLNALVDLERFFEAHQLLADVSALSEQLGNHMDQLRIRWVEAKILAGTGRLYPAEAAFAQVRDEFLALDLPLDVGLVSLELCLVLLRLGRRQEVVEISRESLRVFVDLGARRESMAAFTLLAQAHAS